MSSTSTKLEPAQVSPKRAHGHAQARQSVSEVDSRIATFHDGNLQQPPSLILQRAIGNYGLGRILAPTLEINEPGDIYEREADRVADHVMRSVTIPAQIAELLPKIRRKCSLCEAGGKPCQDCADEEKHIQRQSESSNEPNEGTVPSIVHEVLQSPGEKLDSKTKAFFESSFEYDFGNVRIHNDARAAGSAKAINALAYTSGRNIIFGPGQYSPNSNNGRRLLAHELTHVVQQGAANRTPTIQRQSAPNDGNNPDSETGSTVTDILRDVAGIIGAPASSIASILPTLPASCHPATSRVMAIALHTYVTSSYLPFALGMFGPQTAGLWGDYLNSSLGLPRPARAFSGPGEIVNGFTSHHKSAEAEQEIVDASVVALGGSSASLLPAAGSSTVVPVTSLVPAATLHSRINSGTDPMGLVYDSPGTTIPGNIAGGIGSGGPPGNTTSDPDTRGVSGNMQLNVDPSGTNLTVTPSLNFQVHDTVDFCPGALGGRIARFETVPMSILEATEGTFGPVYAADVPFDVLYPGPGVTKTVAAPPPSSTPPKPAPETPVTPPTPTPPHPPSPNPPAPPQAVSPNPPADLACQTSADTGLTGEKVQFSVSNSVVSTPAQNSAISGFVHRWQSAGSKADVRVDGYASVEGSNDFNWRLSCQRALSVVEALSGDIPSSKITTRAHGPTAEFSPSDLFQNRVSLISSTLAPTPPGPAPVGPTPPGQNPPGPNPPTPVPSGPTPPGSGVSGGVTLKSMQFLSDHHLMKDDRADWENSGNVFPKPDWEPGRSGNRSAPISQNRDTSVVVQLNLDVATGTPAGTPFTLVGRSAAGFLTFTTSGTLKDGSDQDLVLSSARTTPDAITESLGQTINWSIQLPSGSQSLGTVQGLDVFVTMAVPRVPDEVTYKRMAKAVDLTGKVHTLDPQDLVRGIMMKFGAYNLHVQYANAWNLADNIPLGAQCIDIVRFVRGLVQTVGCPGEAEAKLVWAKPTDPGLAVETDAGGGDSLANYPPHPAHPTWEAGLIDANACPNNFEAALKFTFGDTRYYPGGVALADDTGHKITFSNPQQVLEIFQYLAWIEGAGTALVGTKTRDKWIAQEFLISYSHRRTDKVPFTLICDSRVLP